VTVCPAKTPDTEISGSCLLTRYLAGMGPDPLEKELLVSVKKPLVRVSRLKVRDKPHCLIDGTRKLGTVDSYAKDASVIMVGRHLPAESLPNHILTRAPHIAVSGVGTKGKPLCRRRLLNFVRHVPRVRSQPGRAVNASPGAGATGRGWTSTMPPSPALVLTDLDIPALGPLVKVIVPCESHPAGRLRLVPNWR